MDKRTGKRTVNTRQPIANVGLPSYSLQEAIDFVIKVKRAKNLKEGTIKDYIKNMRYFTEWVSKCHADITISDVSANMLRQYTLWCKQDKEYYGGHPFKAEYDKERRGLEASSVNVRIRVLRTFFNVLYKEEV
ncbi:phage integrase SAM-like domain-containing protein [Paenibacillus arenosi]|uniref:phage integrase SAM-like domain-containing protein n=1 Tax=Paenibacillus arenosi TaxID=2774142 RepID=UPI001CDC2862|nr:phage integrase SAM-like domain-containing protein [Paenibacillus arenosi]